MRNSIELMPHVSGYAQETVLKVGKYLIAVVTNIIRIPHQETSSVIIGTIDFPHPLNAPAEQWVKESKKKNQATI